MTNWTIGALMGVWLAFLIVAAFLVMRSNRMTQDACARLMASLERTQASNTRVEAMYSSWRSEAVVDPFRPDLTFAPVADDLRTFSPSRRRPRGFPDSAEGITD